jgi:hypothetical protein
VWVPGTAAVAGGKGGAGPRNELRHAAKLFAEVLGFDVLVAG